MKLHFPTKPFYVTQKWGNPNPMYEDLGFKEHNGIDFVSTKYKSHFPVYCPADGFKVVSVRYVENGGGNEIWLMSKERYLIEGKLCYLYMAFAHADEILVPVGYEPKVGELLLISDNTGFSTGEHCHWGLYRVDYDGKNITWLDTNDANGSYDISNLLSGAYAVDKATFQTHIISGLRLLKYYLSYYK